MPYTEFSAPRPNPRNRWNAFVKSGICAAARSLTLTHSSMPPLLRAAANELNLSVQHLHVLNPPHGELPINFGMAESSLWSLLHRPS